MMCPFLPVIPASMLLEATFASPQVTTGRSGSFRDTADGFPGTENIKLIFDMDTTRFSEFAQSCDYVPELHRIQAELKCPKVQTGPAAKAGGNPMYIYRTAEDIYTAVKPLLQKYDCNLTMREIPFENAQGVGFIYAVAMLVNKDGRKAVGTSITRDIANSRMDPAQSSGSVTSYARKTALGGLFLIDGSKDPDSPSYQQERTSGQKESQHSADAQVDRETGEVIQTADPKAKALAAIAACHTLIELQKVKSEYYHVFDKDLAATYMGKYNEVTKLI